MTSRSARRIGQQSLTAVAAVALVAVSVVASGPDAASAQPSAPASAVLGPTVTHTGKAPTGYSVTFRVYDPTATSMRIKGAWSFASAASTAVDPLNLDPVLPSQWEPGDVAIPSPNGANENWPVASMVKNTATGVWSYTTPLPGGSWDYQFYANCTAAAPALTGCTSRPDPANPAPVTTGSPAVFSQVFVPSDPTFDPEDVSFEAPAPAAQQGRMVDVSVPVAGSTTVTDQVAIYTPAGYNAKRAVEYPLFVLSHGGGENEIAWPTRGRVAQIVDNLVASGQIQPTVIVMPTGVGSADAYDAEIASTVVPFVEQHYNASSKVTDHAYAGTSGYGREAANLLFNHTEQFAYYGLWSPASGAPPVTIPAPGQIQLDPVYLNPALKTRLGIQLAIGQEDIGGNAMMTATIEREGLIQAHVPFRFLTADGGHTWQFWRGVLRNFLTTTAFRATTTAVTRKTTSLVAVVTPSTTEPATPTGKVQSPSVACPSGSR